MISNRAEIVSLFNKKFLFQVFTIGAMFLFLLPFLSGSVKAQTTTCSSGYGQCPTGQVSITKTVENPKTGEFVQILSANDATFAPNGEVDFRLQVQNTGSTTLTNVSVQDQLPDDLNFVSSSPAGTFNSSNRTLSWTIDSLGAGDSSFFQIMTQVLPQSDLNFSIACLTNFAQAQQNQQSASSFASFCIQAQVLQSPTPTTIINNTNSNTNTNTNTLTATLTASTNVGVGTSSGQVLGAGVTTLPKTGLPEIAWALTGLVPLGFKLKRFAANRQSEDYSGDYIFQAREFLKGEVK